MTPEYFDWLKEHGAKILPPKKSGMGWVYTIDTAEMNIEAKKKLDTYLKKYTKRETVIYFGKEVYLDELTDRQINKMKQSELTADWEADQWG